MIRCSAALSAALTVSIAFGGPPLSSAAFHLGCTVGCYDPIVCPSAGVDPPRSCRSIPLASIRPLAYPVGEQQTAHADTRDEI